MPAQPAWFHRLDEILGALRSMTSTHLDRAAVEKLFRVRQRRARQIMAGLEGLRVGNAAAVSREALIARLERTADDGVFQWEGNRRARLVEALDLARRQLAAQHVRIPAAADVRERLLEDLSAGIALRPGELRITFSGAMGRCCMIQLRREWGRFSNFSFRTPQRRISAYPARPSG